MLQFLIQLLYFLHHISLQVHAGYASCVYQVSKQLACYEGRLHPGMPYF